MDFAVGYFATHDGMSPGAVARLVEDYGQAALFFSEHTHIPATRQTPWPGGGELPRKYWHTYDLFVALTHAAAATSRLRIGSGICLVVERDPITTAKEVASVDHLSGGRFEFGVGAGWNREEMRNHGTDPRTRMRLMKERIQAMKEIWTKREASYAGELVHFERIWSYPKPLQQPHPPVLVGGENPKAIERAKDFGDVWFPLFGEDTLALLRELGADSPIPVEMAGLPPTAEAIETCAGLGVRRVSHWLGSGPRSVVERHLERWANAISEFTGS